MNNDETVGTLVVGIIIGILIMVAIFVVLNIFVFLDNREVLACDRDYNTISVREKHTLVRNDKKCLEMYKTYSGFYKDRKPVKGE